MPDGLTPIQPLPSPHPARLALIEDCCRALIAAVNLSARYISDRFLPDKAVDLIDEAAAASGLGPRWADVQADWAAEVGDVLAEAGLKTPAVTAFRSTGRQGVHTEHMGFILAEMQHLQRAFPGGAW